MNWLANLLIYDGSIGGVLSQILFDLMGLGKAQRGSLGMCVKIEVREYVRVRDT
jgi:hypothetical protein